MSAPTTRLVWSRPASLMRIARRTSAELMADGPVVYVDRWEFRSGVEWHTRIDEWDIDVRIPGLDGSTWPQARAAALLHIDALLGARLSLIARARR